MNIKGEERSTWNYGNDKEVNNARDADAEEINTTRTSDNRSSDNANRTNNKMETASNLDRTAVQMAELRAVQAQWDAGNYIVGNTNDVRNTRMIDTPSDTTRKNDAQRTTASSSHPSCTPSLNGSILSAGKQNSIQFQWMPSEAMKKLCNALELASLCPLLETQPDKLHQIIINASSSMLALSRSIFEGETRYQNLASPFKWLIPRQALLGQERRVHLSPPASYRNPSGKQTILHSLPVTYTRTNESLQLKCSGRTRSEIWNCHDQ